MNIKSLALLLAPASLMMSGAQAASLYWDTNGSAAGSGAATGTWGTDQFWTSSSAGTAVPGVVTTTGADLLTFSAGSNGTAGTVTVNGVQNASTVNLLQPGLIFSSGTIALAGTAGNILSVGSSATINSAITANFTTAQAANLAFSALNATLSLGGGVTNIQNATNGLNVVGTSAAIGAASTLQLNAGNYRFGNYNIGDSTAGTGGVFLNSGATATLGTTIGVGTSSNGLFTVNGGVLTNNAAQNTAIVVGRSTGIGRMIVSSGSVAVGGATGTLLVGFQTTTGSGQFDINGGGVSTVGAFAVGSTSSSGMATVNVTGGTSSVGMLNFGKGGNFAASTGGTGVFKMTGGALYIGSGGIVKDGSGSYAYSMTVSGGTLGASAAWSSTLAMTLATAGGNITFRAADAAGAANNITLSGVLSGAGGLNKTGGGTLSLQAMNTYTGNTLVSDGTLILGSTGGLTFVIGADGVNNFLTADSAVSLDGAFTFDLTGAGVDAGDSWTIVNSNGNATYSASFNVTGFTASGDGINWTSGNYNFNEATGVLTVVPEPGVCGLLMAGCGLVLSLRRRRSTGVRC